MTARIKISQAGLAAGVAGKARTDGLDTGALVTLEDVNGTGASSFHLLDAPPEDTTAEASLAATGDPDVWTFSPTAAAYGSYLIELRENGVPVERRVFGIRTAINGLLIPAFNERASRHAGLDNDGAAQIDLSNNNADDFPTASLNQRRYTGWWRSWRELYDVVEAGTGGIADHAIALIKLALAPAKSVIVNATNAAGDAAYLAGSAALQYLRVNAANNGLEMATLAVHASTSVVYDAGTNTFKYGGSTSNVNQTPTSGSLGVLAISTLECGGIVTLQSLSEATIDGFTAKSDGFWFVLHVRDDTTSDSVTLLENVGNTTTSIRTPNIRDWRLTKNESVLIFYSNSRWRVVNSRSKAYLAGNQSVTWAAQQDNFARSGRGTDHLRVLLTGAQTLTGVVPDGVTPNGEVLVITNADTADSLTIAHDATSTAANRFLCPANANFVQAFNTSTSWRYDSTSSRWRMVSRS